MGILYKLISFMTVMFNNSNENSNPEVHFFYRKLASKEKGSISFADLKT